MSLHRYLLIRIDFARPIYHNEYKDISCGKGVIKSQLVCTLHKILLLVNDIWCKQYFHNDYFPKVQMPEGTVLLLQQQCDELLKLVLCGASFTVLTTMKKISYSEFIMALHLSRLGISMQSICRNLEDHLRRCYYSILP